MPTAVIIVTDRGVFLAAHLPSTEPQRAMTATQAVAAGHRSAVCVMLPTAVVGMRCGPSAQQIAEAAQLWIIATGLPLYDMRSDTTVTIGGG